MVRGSPWLRLVPRIRDGPGFGDRPGADVSWRLALRGQGEIWSAGPGKDDPRLGKPTFGSTSLNYVCLVSIRVGYGTAELRAAGASGVAVWRPDHSQGAGREWRLCTSDQIR
jgi:hypothetical protein